MKDSFTNETIDDPGSLIAPGGHASVRERVLALVFEQPAAVGARYACWHLSLPWEKVGVLESVFEGRTLAAVGALATEHIDLAMSAERLVQEVFARCHSPIEELFLANVFGISRSNLNFRWDIDEEQGRIGCYPEHGVTLYAQRRVAGYRVDFSFERDGRSICVELDGHDFHERTKVQAQRDKSRDRAILAAGAAVARFTGSEVWRNTHSCAKEALRLAGLELPA
jgi:hypothetical protein